MGITARDGSATDQEAHTADGVGDVSGEAGGDLGPTSGMDGDRSTACSLPSIEPPNFPVSGTIAGTGVRGTVCTNGAIGFLERATRSSSPFALVISSLTNGSVVQSPVNATGAELSVLIGLSDAAPGKYASDSHSCGGVAFCVTFPVSQTSDCAAYASNNCPAGCWLGGPVLAPTCMPISPQTCFQANDATSCTGTAQAVVGSWTLELDSVELSAGRDSSIARYAAHGSLTAALVEDGGAAPTTAAINLAF